MKKTIVDYKLSGKKVIIRSDLNVPIKDSVIQDDNRIKESVETIKFAVNCGAKVIVMSHLGRVKTEEDKATNTLLPVSIRLSELLNQDVKFVPYTRGIEVENAINNMQDGDVIMLENTRFEDLDGEKESSNNEELGKYWASLADVFINDAFGTCHRAHASNVGIATYLQNGVGFLVKKEIDALMGTLANPKRPFVVILGGAKVEDKLGVIENLLKIADYILIGGGMCFTFIKAMGYNIGSSLCDDTKLEICKNLYEQHKDKIILPVDIMTGTAMVPTTTTRLTNINNIGQNEMGLDIGVETVNKFKSYLLEAGSVIWNGPVGAFELEKFNVGTRKICEILSTSNADTIVGGGDTASAVIKFGYKDKFKHISTGGGASLELMEGKVMPGIAIINDK
ncbi:MAG: phosphoglycerate kinase [Bacilli bacterium]|nr:phosphoglycerate kinase [Bacilli bacterium]